MNKIGFYSNSVINKLQQELAERLGHISGYDDYQLFLINSGAEANENALKLASFTNGRTRVLSAEKAFHGRTALAMLDVFEEEGLVENAREVGEYLMEGIRSIGRDNVATQGTHITDVRGHGKSEQFLKEHTIPANVKIIDLAQDFRIKGSHDYIYGLPETHKDIIAGCQHLANPGCFATCIQSEK